MSSTQDRKGPPPTRHGRSGYVIVSALQKAVRRSQPEQAAAFAIELAQSGHGAWAFKRLREIALEDVSPQATGLVADVAALREQWKETKDLKAVAYAAVALALAPKSRVIDWLVELHGADDATPATVPDEAFDMHTYEGKRMGRGRRHFAEESGRLIPWEGDFEAWDADVRERALPIWLRGDVGNQEPEQLTIEEQR